MNSGRRSRRPNEHDRRHLGGHVTEAIDGANRVGEQGEEVRDGAEHKDGADEADSGAPAAGNLARYPCRYDEARPCSSFRKIKKKITQRTIVTCVTNRGLIRRNIRRINGTRFWC